jgi:hypothetical protein
MDCSCLLSHSLILSFFRFPLLLCLLHFILFNSWRPKRSQIDQSRQGETPLCVILATMTASPHISNALEELLSPTKNQQTADCLKQINEDVLNSSKRKDDPLR